MNTKLLTETADYNVDGSWGAASAAWPFLNDPDQALRIRVIKESIVPYGGYVTVGNHLRIHPDFYESAKMLLQPAVKMSKWIPTTDLLQLRRLGKLGEELNELGAVASRCIIQGLYEIDPASNKINEDTQP